MCIGCCVMPHPAFESCTLAGESASRHDLVTLYCGMFRRDVRRMDNPSYFNVFHFEEMYFVQILILQFVRGFGILCGVVMLSTVTL